MTDDEQTQNLSLGSSDDLNLSGSDLLAKYAHAYAPGGSLYWVTDRNTPRSAVEALAIIKLHLIWGMKPNDVLTGELVLRISDALNTAGNLLAEHSMRLARLEAKSWIRDAP